MTAPAVPETVVDNQTPVVPLPDSPLFANRRHRTPEGTATPVFADNVWPLRNLCFAEHQGSLNLTFARTNAEGPDPVKVYFYNVLNTEPQRRTAQMKTRFPAPGSVAAMYYAVQRLQTWIGKNNIASIAALTENDWNNYAEHIASTEATYGYKVSQLLYFSRVWAHNVDLPSPYAFRMPPRFSATKLTRWLGPAPFQYENRTEPFHPDTISALIVAALGVIDGYLDGTLAIGSRGIKAEARQWLRDQGEPFQRAAITAEQLHRWKQATAWVRRFDKGDVRSAAFIVIAYFTGMRPQEVLHLERDCLTRTPAGPNDSRAYEYTIRGRAFKGQRDEHGDQISEGVVRMQPWVTIEPAARAVEALKRLARPDSPYLFATLYKDMSPNGMRGRHGEVVTGKDVGERLGDFVNLWNSHAERDGRKVVPTDGERSVFGTSKSRVAAARFRRTLAYHIANSPGGEIALGIQYGHVKSVITLGYAGRAESGFPDRVELDALLARWDDLAALTDELQSGSRVSGPAAGRFRDALNDFASQYAGQVQTEATLRRLQRSGLALVHDNPDAHNVCAYVAATALCHPDRDTSTARTTPDLTNCQRGCPNIALLDSHAEDKARQRDRLIAEIESLPLPLADRNKQIADQLDREVLRHEQNGFSK
ncbi:hypothetical protein [Arthrobacter sp. efr-133-R2A-120]|uniref:hypothetical protein n=1 Tax=Arthrobacter sp. efr-133-R2A-120 TaxID=3040277 RepID=UPI00254D073A|nr:hypothetical protein [Arthrobacter sp. efr-133-R2A-120]